MCRGEHTVRACCRAVYRLANYRRSAPASMRPMPPSWGRRARKYQGSSHRSQRRHHPSRSTASCGARQVGNTEPPRLAARVTAPGRSHRHRSCRMQDHGIRIGDFRLPNVPSTAAARDDSTCLRERQPSHPHRGTSRQLRQERFVPKAPHRFHRPKRLNTSNFLDTNFCSFSGLGRYSCAVINRPTTLRGARILVLWEPKTIVVIFRVFCTLINLIKGRIIL